MSCKLLKHPSAWIPLAMSLTALCVVVGHIALSGHAREIDEGAAAHLFQLLIALQIPVAAFFAVKWLRREPLSALLPLALQALAAAAACAPVWYFRL